MKRKWVLFAAIAIVVIAAAIMGIYHIPRKTEITLQAMLVTEDGSTAKMTELSLSGKMTHYLLGDNIMVFDGDVKIAAEPFSEKPGTYHQTIYFPRAENDSCLTGHGVYFIPDSASSLVYSDTELSKIILQIRGWDDEVYYVIAPASSWQEIHGVFDDLGMSSPF